MSSTPVSVRRRRSDTAAATAGEAALERSEPVPARPELTTRNVRIVAGSAAIIYGSAAALCVVEGLTPGGARGAVAPGIAAGVISLLAATIGRRLPRRALALLGPLGAAMIAYVLDRTQGAGDGAVLYFWPVMWTSYFYGRRGAIGIVMWVAIIHGIVLASMPFGTGNADRWIDVVVALATTAAVIHYLGAREQRLVEELQSQASTDTITGLLNRRGFEERVPRELALAARNAWEITLITFDIDRFKDVNDQWGHRIGDTILADFGRTLRTHARATDLAARIGGEEFVVLLPDTDTDTAFEIAERIRTAFTNASRTDGPVVTVSAGVASATAPRELERLLQEGDYALYTAKRTGRNQTIVHVLEASPEPQALQAV